MELKDCDRLGVDSSGKPKGQGDSWFVDPVAERGTMAVEHTDCTLCWNNLYDAVSWISSQGGHLRGQAALGVRSWWAVGCSGVRKVHETSYRDSHTLRYLQGELYSNGRGSKQNTPRH